MIIALLSYCVGCWMAMPHFIKMECSFVKMHDEAFFSKFEQWLFAPLILTGYVLLFSPVMISLGMRELIRVITNNRSDS